jgi:hypothetical protein
MTGGNLHGLHQTPNLSTVVGINGRDVQSQDVAKRFDSQVD